MRVHVVDPSAYSRPYDHELCAALARAGAEVDLITSAFPYGRVPEPRGYGVREVFYRGVPGGAASRLRSAAKLAAHVPDMLRYRRAARAADVVHFQWLPLQWLDAHLLPDRPLVLTAHDLLPREPRPGQARAQRRLYHAVDAVVVHSRYGRRKLVEELGVDAAKVHVVHHGAFTHLVGAVTDGALPPELDGGVTCGPAPGKRPVALFFGLLRAYKGVEVLLEAWRGVEDAELWIVGHPRIPLERLRAAAPAGVRFAPRFVEDAELAACFARADVVVLPYLRTERFDQSGVLATALAFGKATVVSDVGSFAEVASAGAARLVPGGDVVALREALRELLGDAAMRERLGAAARSLAHSHYSWDAAAQLTLALYRELTG